MKFSLNNRQDASYLLKADEILIEYRDRKAIPDYAEKYPEAALVLEVRPTDMPIQLADIRDEIILSKGKLTLSLPVMDPIFIQELQEKNIPYMYGFSVSSAWELDALEKMGVSQVRIEAPLFFQKDVLLKSSTPKRVVANTAHEGYIPTMEGIVGSWIRPEDLDLYDGIIDTIEFRDIDKKREQALYRIYAEQHNWPGPINMLISNTGLDNTKVNRMLPKEFTEHRLNCGQRCMSGGACRLCYRMISLADPELIKEYKEAVYPDKEKIPSD